MNDSGPAGRPAVQAFFDYRLDDDELKPLAARYKLALWLGAGGAVIGLTSFGLAFAAGLAAIGLSLGIALDRWWILRDLSARSSAKEANHTEFRRLARETRTVQGADVIKALVRVFERTKLDRNRLRVLEQRYLFEQERALLDQATLARRAGDLVDKSIRMISRGDQFSPRSRQVRGLVEQLVFNPVRLVTLFVTETQLVICDVQVDSIGGDLLEEIQRIALSKIVNISFRVRRQRVAKRERDGHQLADPVASSEGDDDERSEGRSSDVGREEEVLSLLGITCTDGATVTVPIRSESYLGRARGALDEGGLLSDDEVMIDGMIDELTRLIDRPSRRSLSASER